MRYTNPRLLYFTLHCPSVLWHCWLGHLTCEIVPKMMYNVSSGRTLNCTIPVPYVALVSMQLKSRQQLCCLLTASGYNFEACWRDDDEDEWASAAESWYTTTFVLSWNEQKQTQSLRTHVTPILLFFGKCTHILMHSVSRYLNNMYVLGCRYTFVI